MKPKGTNSRRDTGRTRGRLAGVLIAATALLAMIPASAQALSLTGSHGEPANPAAGASSDFNVHVAISPSGEDVKDLTISLPPGEVGNPQATPLCSPGQLPNCPANTQVGTTATSVTISGLLPQTLNGSVYNLVPQPGEPARFGIVINALPIALPAPLNGLVLPPTVIQSGVQLRQSDFGLDTVINDIPKTATLTGLLPLTVPIHINSMDVTLNGTVRGNSFMRNPTSCTDHTVRFSAVSYTSTQATAENHFTPTNCGALDFSPSLRAWVGGPGQTASGVPTTVSTSIDQDNGEAGLLNAAVAVPSDFNPNAAIFGGACDPASFLASSCPGSSVVGSAVATSPLLSLPLTGGVMLVSSSSGIPNIGLDLSGQLHLLLQGSVDITKKVTFNGLPDIPIAHFQLTFTSPPGMLGTTRNLCVPPAPLFHADFQGYNGASSSVDAVATVDGCGPRGAKLGKCRKAKKKGKHRAAEVAKKHKKKSCKKKRKHKKRR
jgi:hypothetical protein